jgi:hypothetical protein
MIASAAALFRALRGKLGEARGRDLRDRACCSLCAHFRDDSNLVEAAMPGLASLSSGHASVRASDGICLRLGRYLSGRAHCVEFAARSAADAARLRPAPTP